MKQKIFTLLLAIGVLTAFQANALQRQKISIKADTSGLANTKSSVPGNDSFPFTKTDFQKWLSVTDGKLVAVPDTFEYDVTDSTKFKFFRPGAKASKPLVLKNSANEADSSFAIIKLKSGSNAITGGKKTAGYKGELVKNTPGDKEGYLISVPKGADSLRLDTITGFSLVGAKNGALSLKKFNEFAFYGDSVPYAPFWKYQYDSTFFGKGRLYQSNSFPYFQIYDTLHKENSKTDTVRLIHEDTNMPSNWGNITRVANPNPNDPLVYTWLNIKLSGDTALVLLDTIIHLDTIKHFADTVGTSRALLLDSWYDGSSETWSSKTWKGLDSTHLHADSISPFINKDGTDSAYHVYLKKEVDGFLSFTVKTDSTSKESDWTNGYPTKLLKENNNSDSCYYRIDTMFFRILPDIIEELVVKKGKGQGWTTDSLFNPKTNHISRYLYKEDDSWRPLYVKLEDATVTVESMKKDTAQYVGWEWVKKNHYHLNAAVQTIADGTESGISLGSGAKAKFKFEQADTIKNGKFAKTYKRQSKQTEPSFHNEGAIELFRINNGGKYLTVLDATEFTDVRSDTFTVATNTQLGWQGIIPTDTIECARQMFAIVHNYADTTTTFLPVASRKWVLEGDIAKYVTTDTLFFNPGIGLNLLPTSSDTVDFSETWYLTKKAQLDSPTDYKLVIADSASKTERVWFDLKSTLEKWNGPDSTYVSVRKGAKYYHGDNVLVDGILDMNNDIKAHWKINKVKDVNNAWKFTPVVDSISGTDRKLFAGKPVFAFKETGLGDSILLIDDANENVVDTVCVDSIYPTKFSLFKKLETEIDTTVIIVSKGKYIALDTIVLDNDSIVAVALDTTGTKNPVKVTESNVKYLVDGLYPIHHYIFSIEKDGKKYFLNAGDSIVRWVSLDPTRAADLPTTTNKAYASFKFALPNFETDGVYLQTLDTGKLAGPYVINFVADKLKVVDVQDSVSVTGGSPAGIYSAIDFYNKGKSSISTWGFIETEVPGNDPKEEWLSKTYFGFITGNEVKGVFSAGERYISYDVDHYGILQDTPDTLTLKYKEDVGTVETFNIVIDSLCLSVSEDKAIFIDTATVQASTSSSAFAFCKVGESGFAIVSAAGINSGELRYLAKGNGDSLIFVAEDGEEFTFTRVGEDPGTGIKAITASGKIYGVAGGVKVLGATGAVAIYTIDGRLVTKKTVTSPNQTIAVPAGIYVVRNGAEATKVVVK